MQVQLYALFPFGIVRALLARRFQYVVRHDDIIPFKTVVFTAPAYYERIALFQFVQPVAVLILLQPQLYIDRAGVICDGNGIYLVIIPFQFCGEHIAPYRYLACVLPHLLQRGGLVRLEYMPIDHLCRHILQGKAGHLQSGKVFFRLEYLYRCFLQHFLFQLVCIYHFLTGKIYFRPAA